MEAGEVPQEPADAESLFRRLRVLGLGFAYTALHLLGADAEDRVQSGLAVMADKVKKKPALLTNEKEASLLLCGIMKHQHFMELRHESVVQANQAELSREADDHQSLVGTPDYDMAMGQLRGLEYTALNELKPDTQMIIQMHFFDGLKIAEIAKELGKRPRWVSNKLDRALTQLAKNKALGAFFEEWEFDA